MKNRLSLLALGFVGILALTPSCGGDEGTGDGDDGGGSGGNSSCTIDEDCPRGRFCVDVRGDGDGFCQSGEVCICAEASGTGGASGSGTGGSSGATITGGTSGTGGNVSPTALGNPCAVAADCGDDGLICLLADGLPSGNGPPNGLCTVPCMGDDVCLELANSAYCVAFEEGADPMNPPAYCILGCTGGAAGAPKCGVRDDFACGILDTTPTTQSCASTAECPVNHVCFSDPEGTPPVCQTMTTACRPVCRADADCVDGQFCDFGTGFCSATEPTGLAIGALCDPNATTDPCNGFCLATDDTDTEGTCTAFCSAGLDAYGCGWVGDGAADAGCLFPTVVSRTAAGGISLAESDLMLCGGLCDCNDDCPAAVDRCMDENATDPAGSIMVLFGRQGYCRPLIAAEGETEADSFECAQAGR